MNADEQLANLIAIGLRGDKIAFARQASKLARTYEEVGKNVLAKEIRNSILEKDSYTLQKASASMRGNFSRLDTLPTDQETKFDLADISEPTENITKPLLKTKTIEKIKEFILFTEKAKDLKDAGLGITSSMLLFGPPGCGKTMAAHYIASLLHLPLITARCDSLVSSYLGSTSKNIRQLFDYASKKPCVLFLDELDALAKARDDQHELGELKRVVVSLLQNIDQLPEHTIIIAASNHEELLDSAVWRRFDYRISVELPDFQVRKMLFEQYPLISDKYEDISGDLAVISQGLTCAFIEQCCSRALRHAYIYNDNNFDCKFLIEAIFESKNLSYDNEDEWISNIVNQLREYDKKRFTIRKIAKLLGLSTAKASRITK